MNGYILRIVVITLRVMSAIGARLWDRTGAILRTVVITLRVMSAEVGGYRSRANIV
ncbi:hypothetical protein FTUN_3552 [Frigoriglobus tundricola]|uniref:Uncharacterized protein n=1 Tax=Frigoriglobus tundricola TaxID=2774151 RepID=A0A6M5YPZ5_9BACT|nr:hypothetical protein FTUN_3552 [Frigoriglobus tundricola]